MMILASKKINLTHFGESFGTLRFDKISFFNTLLGFSPYWDYKPRNSTYPELQGIYTSDEVLNINTIDEIHSKYNGIDGSIQNGLSQPILFGFVLHKKQGFKEFREQESKLYKEINKSVLHTITFYLEDDNIEKVDFDGKTSTFTLHMIEN